MYKFCQRNPFLSEVPNVDLFDFGTKLFNSRYLFFLLLDFQNYQNHTLNWMRKHTVKFTELARPFISFFLYLFDSKFARIPPEGCLKWLYVYFSLNKVKAHWCGRGHTPFPHPAPTRSLRSLALALRALT